MTKATSTKFFYDRRLTFYRCLRLKVIKKGLNFDLEPILITSLKILMGQIGDEKTQKCTLTTIHAMYF